MEKEKYDYLEDVALNKLKRILEINNYLLDYDQAYKLALKMPWKIDTCHMGENCWCRIIVPENDIYYRYASDGREEEFCIIGDGAIGEDMAKYIVGLHNNKIKNMGVSDFEKKLKLLEPEFANYIKDNIKKLLYNN